MRLCRSRYVLAMCHECCCRKRDVTGVSKDADQEQPSTISISENCLFPILTDDIDKLGLKRPVNTHTGYYNSRMNSLLRSARHPTFTRSFSTSISRSEHFLNATPEVFNEKVLKGDDRVVLVDFFAESVLPS